MSIQKKIKEKSLKFINSRYMLSSLAAASFLESTIVPIPLEAILIPLMQAHREKLWLITLMAILGSIIGALFGYALGYYLFDIVGELIINTLSTPDQFYSIKQKMDNQGFWFVMSLGLIPVPFQIAMLAAGATKFSLTLFLIAATISRSIRYVALAVIVYHAGDKAEQLILKHKTKSMIILSLIIIVIWLISFY